MHRTSGGGERRPAEGDIKANIDAKVGAERVLSASEVERVLKRRVEERLSGPGGLGLSGLCVEGVLGETEDLRRYGRTIYGISLTDEGGGARLDLAVPSRLEEDLASLEFSRVLVRGDLEARTFKGSFRFQLNVREIEPAEEDPSGERRRADKSLVAVLKGYRRRPRPFPPTSPEEPARVLVLHPKAGVVLRDFAEGLANAPVVTEGLAVSTNDPEEMARVVQEAQGTCDVLVMVRGGGPAEDLQPFDDARLAEAWMEHPAYTISAVGHAQDSTVLDVLSDAACPTPTAAGALVAAKAREAAEVADAGRAAAERDAARRDLAMVRSAVVLLSAVVVVLLIVVIAMMLA